MRNSILSTPFRCLSVEGRRRELLCLLSGPLTGAFRVTTSRMSHTLPTRKAGLRYRLGIAATGADASLAGPAFALFLLVNVTLFLRPAELLPSLADLPIYEVLILSACLFSAQRMKRQLSRPALLRQPITLCVMGLLLAAVLSHLSHMNLYGIKAAGVELAKVVVYYLLLLAVVDSPGRLVTLLKTVAISASIMVGICVLDYLGIYDLPVIDAIKNRDGVTATGSSIYVARMRGMGIFQDPNDISLVIVAAGVLCGFFLTDRNKPAQRPLWLFLLILLACGLYFTRSRGGLLAAGGAGFAFAWCRYGSKTAYAVVLIGLCLLPFAGGRQTSIDLSSGTGHDRLLLWRDGISAIQSPAIVFGIGAGMYGDVAGMVAHNSFIHAFVEMGLIGGTCFFGLFFLPGLAIYRSQHVHIRHQELARFRPYLAAVLGGWCTGMLSLSRCYVVPTFLIVGMAAAYLNLSGPWLQPRQLLIFTNRRLFQQLCTASAAAFAFIYSFVALFA